MAEKLILVIDDSKVSLMRTNRELENAGYAVITENNAYSVFESAIDNHPKLIICDYTMPGMNADRIIRKLKTDAATAGIPIIVYSSQSDQPLVENVIELGASALVEKSGDYTLLLEKIKELLGENDFMVEF